MRHFVYILKLGDGRLYVGETANLERRKAEHGNKPGSRTSYIFGTEGLVYTEEYADRTTALKREAQLKGWSAQKKEALIRGDKKMLSLLAKSQEKPSGSSIKKVRSSERDFLQQRERTQ